MTNEEKAREIAQLCDCCLSVNGEPDQGCCECETRGVFYGALEMAEWKDQEFDAKINYLHDLINDKTDFEKAYFVVTGTNWQR